MLSWRRTEYCFRIRCPFGLNREFSTPLSAKLKRSRHCMRELVQNNATGFILGRLERSHELESGELPDWQSPCAIERLPYLRAMGRGLDISIVPMLWLCVYSPLFHSEKGFFVLSFFIVYLQQVYGNHCSFPNWFYWFYCIILSGVSLTGTLYFFWENAAKSLWRF